MRRSGPDDALDATVAVVSGTPVLELDDPADEVGLIEAPCVVTAALAVAVIVAVRVVVVVSVVVVVRVEAPAGAVDAGCEAGGIGDWGVFETDVRDPGAALDAGERSDVLDVDGREVGVATFEGDLVGARVGVGVPGFDGRLSVGIPTVGRDDLAGSAARNRLALSRTPRRPPP